MTRRELLGAALAAGTLSAQARSKPNVVFFMTDDHGAWALNAYGCSDILRTPNIDRLAERGTLVRARLRRHPGLLAFPRNLLHRQASRRTTASRIS